MMVIGYSLIIIGSLPHCKHVKLPNMVLIECRGSLNVQTGLEVRREGKCIFGSRVSGLGGERVVWCRGRNIRFPVTFGTACSGQQ